nr:site-specific integrase [Ardenticatena sp.]
MGKPRQLSLFSTDDDAHVNTESQPIVETPPLRPTATLAAAINAYRDYMLRKKFSQHTIKAFTSDLRLLMRYLGKTTPIDTIRTAHLKQFLTWLREERGVPCSPKSYQRRVTTLKSFFKWLHDEDVLPSDPAAPILHQRAATPLPHILYDDEIERILAVARQRRYDLDHPDARPYLLFTLLLKTGIKKGECVNIKLTDIDTSHPDAPELYVRYKDPRHAHKERKLALPRDFAEVLREYLAQYAPEAYLFECTPRNLEYVLQGLAEEAGVVKGCSFAMLRMTCAVRDWQAGMPPDVLRRKLGLSEITWRETEPKIAILAERGL